MPAPDEVTRLVERFQENRQSFLASQYNETQLRQEFLNPFFTALGWDVADVSGYAEAYKDVAHEDAITIGGMTKVRRDRTAGTVQRMLDLHKQLAAAKTAHEKTMLQRQITATDRQIEHAEEM